MRAKFAAAVGANVTDKPNRFIPVPDLLINRNLEHMLTRKPLPPGKAGECRRKRSRRCMAAVAMIVVVCFGVRHFLPSVQLIVVTPFALIVTEPLGLKILQPFNHQLSPAELAFTHRLTFATGERQQLIPVAGVVACRHWYGNYRYSIDAFRFVLGTWSGRSRHKAYWAGR